MNEVITVQCTTSLQIKCKNILFVTYRYLCHIYTYSNEYQTGFIFYKFISSSPDIVILCIIIYLFTEISI